MRPAAAEPVALAVVELAAAAEPVAAVRAVTRLEAAVAAWVVLDRAVINLVLELGAAAWAAAAWAAAVWAAAAEPVAPEVVEPVAAEPLAVINPALELAAARVAPDLAVINPALGPEAPAAVEPVAARVAARSNKVTQSRKKTERREGIAISSHLSSPPPRARQPQVAI
ncbi:MAG TPA: hypothetical protein VK138_00660 [Acidiferrobacterales bacterium]|nr:hypothetical protein [Acidiferrobacterales bacterium]